MDLEFAKERILALYHNEHHFEDMFERLEEVATNFWVDQSKIDTSLLSIKSTETSDKAVNDAIEILNNVAEGRFVFYIEYDCLDYMDVDGYDAYTPYIEIWVKGAVN